MSRMRMLIAIAIPVLFATALAGAAPAPMLVVDSAVWNAERGRLEATGAGTLSGRSPRIALTDDAGNALPGRLRFDYNSREGGLTSFTWRFTSRGLDAAPCVVAAEAATGNTQSDPLDVTNRPASCGGGSAGNLAPVCSVTAPATPTVTIQQGKAVNFAAQASDPDGDPLTYEWNFAGGAANSTVLNAGLVQFGTAGTFAVVFRASDGQASCEVAATTVTVTSIIANLPPPVFEQPLVQGNAYRVFANNDLGMHCADLGTAPFSVLPPFNNLNAQLVRRGVRPQVVSPDTANFELRYSAVSNPDDPVGAGSINSTSSNYPVGANSDEATLRKSDFWDVVDGISYPEILFGTQLAQDQGLIFNQFMPGAAAPFEANDPQPFGVNEHLGTFAAIGIPVTPIDDTGRHNPYPLFRVQAVDRSTGRVVSTVDTVVPVSDELNCQACHLSGQIAADPGARNLPFVEPANPADRLSVEMAAKFNILLLHDFRHGDAYEQPLAERASVLCASCHNSPALSEVGGPAGDPAREPMSRVMHGFHGQLVVNASSGALIRDGNGEPVLVPTVGTGQRRVFPVDLEDPSVTMEQNCFQCHPGRQTQCFRGVMRTAGLQCASCHGDMAAVGGVFPLGSSGGPRHPWVDEPRCESCHNGESVALRVAFNRNDPSAMPLLAVDKRFAENDGTLYRNSKGHGELLCETCHGSPHAIWPVGTGEPRNDNVAAVQLQGHSGTLSECSVCHTGFPDEARTLDGPHGMHPVGNTPFTEHHAGLWERNADDCRTCHGQNLEGTRLSRTFADRVLKSDRKVNGSNMIAVAKGTEVSCTLCHERPR